MRNSRLNDEDNPDIYFSRQRRRTTDVPQALDPDFVTDEEQATAYRNMELGLEPDDVLGRDININPDEIMNDVQSRFQEMLNRLENEE